MNSQMTYCPICGKLFVKRTGNQRYCSASCSKDAKREQSKIFSRQEREAMKLEREERARNRSGSRSAPKRKGMFDLTGKELGDVALEARSLGMSYGEYVTAATTGTISARLAVRGISPAQAKKKIEKGYSERVPVKKRRRTASYF